MLMKDTNSKVINPFSKVTTLRGFNNTTDNIRRQMKTAKKGQSKTELNNDLQKPSYDPSKQRETMITMDKLKRE